ncbi:hypothetical protein CLOAM0857 [Candidatus Cloacimonas acidaminovorans str. Evry]|uniref:Uncharacterized protein n=1 Tax=Cloacimonas acidaminovorans (strain Evry) TaxID=459349 RepID=B0VHC3_CLOAI|nr:hypothetical protein CLOAM0857 [Candidatus Cloacimonas acidaminovorans str. Evry]
MSYLLSLRMNRFLISYLQNQKDILCLTYFMIDYIRKIVCIANSLYKPWQDKKRS